MFRSPAQVRCALRSKPVAYAIVIRWSRQARCRFNIRAYPATKSLELLMRSDQPSVIFRRVIELAVGWHGGYCGHCEPCRRGNFFACELGRVTGLTHDGGYAEYMIAHRTALARLPDGLSAVAAAPLVCAGVTTFNALRNSGARAGDTVAILGIGRPWSLGRPVCRKNGIQNSCDRARLR